MASKKIIRHKCPFCDKRFIREDLVIHIEENHEDLVPQNFTPFRYVFNYVNKKTTDYHGKCTECGGPTPWDENKGRYNRQCEKPSCKASFIKNFESNMIRTRGVTRISSTAEGQAKMLANRKISGKYKFKNGVEKTYTGSYELKALEFMDQVMNISPDDIMCPGPILEYTYNGKRHLYISDFYYQPYNLIIEVKDGGSRPNRREMPEYRGKQIAKEEFIIKYTNYNYLRLTDNDLSQLLSVFADLKMQMVENTGERVIHINENLSQQKILESISENKEFNNEEIYKNIRKILRDNDIKIKVDKSIVDEFISCKNNNLWLSAGRDIGKAIDLLEPVVKQYHGKINCDNYGSIFLSFKKSSYNEAMNALMTGYIPGTNDTGSVYIVNYMKNNIFSGEPEFGYGITDNCKLTNLICRNKEGVLSKAPDNFLENSKYNVYLVDMTKEEVSKRIGAYLETFVEEGFLYESIFGKKMYSYDQIETESTAHPVIDYYFGMNTFSKIVESFLRNGRKPKDCFVISENNSFMGLNVSDNKESICVCYGSIKDNKYYLESVEYPEFIIESDEYNDDISMEKRVLEMIGLSKRLVGGKKDGQI